MALTNSPSIDISQAKKIRGWMSESELLWLSEQASKHHSVCEVGVFLGRSTVALLQHCAGTVLAVDTFLGSPGSAVEREAAPSHGDDIYRQFVENTLDFDNLAIMRCRSETAAVLLDKMGYSCDLLFLDGDHSVEALIRDIELFRPLLEPGAILAGHDFGRDTIHESLLRCGIKPQVVETIWWTQV